MLFSVFLSTVKLWTEKGLTHCSSITLLCCLGLFHGPVSGSIQVLGGIRMTLLVILGDARGSFYSAVQYRHYPNVISAWLGSIFPQVLSYHLGEQIHRLPSKLLLPPPATMVFFGLTLIMIVYYRCIWLTGILDNSSTYE